jgi:two-component system, response regulator PdtaR
MAQTLRILIAEDDSLNAMALRAQLEALGHDVVAVAPDGEDAVRLASETTPDLAILDIRMPRLSGLDAAARIFADRPLPIVLLTGYSDPDAVAQAARLPVYVYLVKPVDGTDLAPAIGVAVQRFADWQRLDREVSELERKLADRKLVERAKGVLMDARGLSEREAYRLLQKESQNRNQPMAEVARTILMADPVLRKRDQV